MTMNCRFVVTIFIIINLVHTLHYDYSHQQASTTSDQQFYKQLVSLQTKLNTSILNVQQNVKDLSAKIKAEGTVPTQQTDSLKQGVIAEGQAIKDLEDHIKAPLAPKPCNTTSQTAAARDSLNKQATQLKDSVNQLKKDIANCTKCTVSADLNSLILQQENYLGVINSIVASNCTQAPPPYEPAKTSGLVDLSNSNYKDNLAAKNWIFGNITEDQYKYQVFAESIKYNLTSCPIEKPYVNPISHICFDCPQGMSFNLGEKTCQNCSTGFTYNMSTNQCQSTCKADQVYNTTSKQCQHQPQPIVAASQCPPDQPIWNSTTKSCQTCPPTTPLYNQTQQKCLPCPANTTWNSSLKKCISICSSTEVYDPKSQKCVTPPPQCPAGQIWNDTSKSCQSICSSGTTYNNITKQCQNTTEKVCNDIKPLWNANTSTCQLCPEETPVWNITFKKCQSCPAETPVFDYTIFKCVEKICDKGTLWNKNLKKCSPLTKNCSIQDKYVFSNQSCVKICEINQTYFPDNNSCSCSPQKPIFNNTTRLCEEPVCPSGKKWNTNLLQCIDINKTCENSQIYNFTSGQCQAKCQAGVPYNATSDSCICPKERPRFDNNTRKCTIPVCANGTKWNTLLLKCSLQTQQCEVWQLYHFPTQSCVNKCEVNHTYIRSDDSCQCPPQYPIFSFTTRLCQEPVCPSGQLWNTLELKCALVNKNCQTWQVYIFNNESCVQKCQNGTIYSKKYDNCTCPPQRPLYNQTQKKCIEYVCPTGYKFNPQLVSCISLNGSCEIWQSYNFTAGECQVKCQINQTYYPANDTCSCPSDRTYFNTTTRNCTYPPCPNGTQWNIHLLNCTPLTMPCQLWQLYSFKLGKCVDECEVNHTYIASQNRCQCFPQAPQYNAITHKCTQPECPTGSLWNNQLIKCSIVKVNCSAWQSYNFTSESCDQQCEVNVTYDGKVCLCPPERPFFEAATKKCIEPNCSQGYKYNPEMIKCSPISLNCTKWEQELWSAEQCKVQCEVNHTYYKNNDSCSCTPDAPFFNTTSRKCQPPVCQPTTQWNLNLLKCSPLTKPCERWQNYNFTTQKCENKCQVNYSYYPSNGTCQCPKQTPYYDTNTQKCRIPQCQNNTKWNIHLFKCSLLDKNCSENEWYNFTIQSCQVMCIVNQQYHPATSRCQCKAEYPVYNPTNHTCIQPTCPNNSDKWNIYLLKCSPTKKDCNKWQFYDFAKQQCQVKCEINHTYYYYNDSCQCFDDRPVFNRTTFKCQVPACDAESRFNPHMRKCTPIFGHCHRWQEYNFTDQSCINKCDQLQTYFPENKTCSCYPADPIFNITSRKCQEPICYNGTLWNRTLAKCRCKFGYFYSRTIYQCQLECKDGENYNYTTKTCDKIQIPKIPKCGENMFVNSNNQCQCLTGFKLTSDGKHCRLNCTDGFKWNQDTLKCEKIQCQPGYFFSSATQLCQKEQVHCPDGYFYNNQTQKCVSCPYGYVYNYDKNICQAYTIQTNCPVGYHFNPVTRLCDTSSIICPDYQYYDQTTKSCRQKYITSPQASNLITSNMTEYIIRYNAAKKSNPHLQDCAAPTAFYDRKINTCVSCTKDHPYFNLEKDMCESCGSYKYDANSHSCVKSETVNPNVDIGPTIGRFISNLN